MIGCQLGGFALVWGFLSLLGPASACGGCGRGESRADTSLCWGPPAQTRRRHHRAPGHPGAPRALPGNPGTASAEPGGAGGICPCPVRSPPAAAEPDPRAALPVPGQPLRGSLPAALGTATGTPPARAMRRGFTGSMTHSRVFGVLLWKAQMGICACLSREQEWLPRLHPQHLCFLELDRQQVKANPSFEGPKVWLGKPNESSALEVYFSSELCDVFTKTFVFILPQSSRCCYC